MEQKPRKTCRACDSPLCPLCGGCIGEGECTCLKVTEQLPIVEQLRNAVAETTCTACTARGEESASAWAAEYTSQHTQSICPDCLRALGEAFIIASERLKI
jgi:hypothetical protein